MRTELAREETTLREIWVREINESTALEFCELAWRAVEENPYKPLIIKISSYGGCVDSLFTMLDCLDSIRSRTADTDLKILTVATGKACSAGAVLLCYGDIRFATPNTRIMVHQIVSGGFGSQPANKVEFLESERINDRMLQILLKQCKLNMTLEQLKEKLSHNWYLDLEEALKVGLIDVVGEPYILEKTAYEVRVLNAKAPGKEQKRAKRKKTV